jgi:hypothetical protein
MALQTILVALESVRDTSNRLDDHLYDTDSYLIAIDNGSSRCITNNTKDFVGKVRKVNLTVRGIGGNTSATLVGTVRWRIEDNEGKVHSFLIPGTYYNKGAPYRLLSPQHWSETRKEKRRSGCTTYHDGVEMFWNKYKDIRSIPLDGSTNIALVRSAPDYSRLHSFYDELSKDEDTTIDESELYCMPAAVSVSDDESSLGSSSEGSQYSEEEPIPVRRHPDLPDSVFPDVTDELAASETVVFDDLMDSEVHEIPEDEDVQGMTPQAELLKWHYRLGHLPFGRIQHLAGRGDLPAYLAKAKVPLCAACMFGKATKRPWRTRAPKNKMTIPAATCPGAVVAVDQLVSSTPGLIGQMSGFLTHKRFVVTTVFVDHFSGLSFVHNQISTAADHTVEGKKAFERYAKSHGVNVLHYHADNGIFASKQFVAEVHSKGQTISYCAVNAHHQNGVAEKKI